MTIVVVGITVVGTTVTSNEDIPNVSVTHEMHVGRVPTLPRCMRCPETTDGTDMDGTDTDGTDMKAAKRATLNPACCKRGVASNETSAMTASVAAAGKSVIRSN